MGILADFEDSIGKVIEGTFGGIFRSHVQPAEIARVCAKEMDRSKKLGVGKVYVANFYNIILSPRDGDALGGLTATLKSELETYLLAHARENSYQLPTQPAVNFITDPELRLGRFDVVGETMSQAEIDKELGAGEAIFTPPPSYTPPSYVNEPTVEPFSEKRTSALSYDGVFPPPRATLVSTFLGNISIDDLDMYTIGRKDTCDIKLEDSAASRLHATLTHDESDWILTDNDATNTTQVNGRPITTQRLRDGDVITIGTTQFTYHKADRDFL